MDYPALLAELFGLRRFGMELGLSRMQRVLGRLKQQGALTDLGEDIIPFADRQRMVDHARYQALERKYAAA